MIERLRILSVVPSPYQRDVFAELHRLGPPLQVHYLERTPHDSPWPEATLEPWEHILPGVALNWGNGRCHINRLPPAPRPDEFWLLNTAMTSLTGQVVMRRLGRRTPWAFWGEVPSHPTTALGRWLQRRQYAPLRRARFIAAVGQHAVAAYQTLVPGPPVINVPYACDLSGFHATAQVTPPSADPVFLFCGQMIPRKGIDLLLAAFRRVVEAELPARLILAGREADIADRLRILPAPVRSRVHCEGFHAPADLPALFARANVFVLPSRHDGWGVVVNEALGAGLPVIVSDRVGASELISPGREGLIVPAGDTAALAMAMTTLARSAPLRESMAHAARQRSHDLSPLNTARSLVEAMPRAMPS